MPFSSARSGHNRPMRRRPSHQISATQRSQAHVQAGRAFPYGLFPNPPRTQQQTGLHVVFGSHNTQKRTQKRKTFETKGLTKFLFCDAWPCRVIDGAVHACRRGQSSLTSTALHTSILVAVPACSNHRKTPQLTTYDKSFAQPFSTSNYAL